MRAELDPRTLGGLPRRDSVLPATLAPPAAGTRVAGLPLDGPARLVLAQGRGRLLLLGEDGRWAATRTPSGDSVASGISADGTMLAATGPHGLWVVDVRDGEWRELALPDEPAPPWTSRGTRVQWQGDDRVVLTDVGQFLAMPTDAGTPVADLAGGPAGRPGHRLRPDGGRAGPWSWAATGVVAARSSPRSRTAASPGSCRPASWGSCPDRSSARGGSRAPSQGSRARTGRPTGRESSPRGEAPTTRRRTCRSPAPATGPPSARTSRAGSRRGAGSTPTPCCSAPSPGE